MNHSDLQLYLVHCGYYDLEVLEGIYEHHVNFVVAATSFEDARVRVKTEPEFIRKRMHVDGLQRIEAAQGYRVSLLHAPELNGASLVQSNRHRDLAPKKTDSV